MEWPLIKPGVETGTSSMIFMFTYHQNCLKTGLQKVPWSNRKRNSPAGGERTPQVPTAKSTFEANQISVSAFQSDRSLGTERPQDTPELSCTPGPTSHLAKGSCGHAEDCPSKAPRAASTSHLQGSAMGKEKSKGLFVKMAGQRSLYMGFAKENILSKGLS